jgi:hypothetical protein
LLTEKRASLSCLISKPQPISLENMVNVEGVARRPPSACDIHHVSQICMRVEGLLCCVVRANNRRTTMTTGEFLQLQLLLDRAIAWTAENGWSKVDLETMEEAYQALFAVDLPGDYVPLH